MSDQEILDYSARALSQSVNKVTAKFHETVEHTFIKLGQKYKECIKSGGKMQQCQTKYSYKVPQIILDTDLINTCLSKARASKDHPFKQVDKCVHAFEKYADGVFTSLTKQSNCQSKS